MYTLLNVATGKYKKLLEKQLCMKLLKSRQNLLCLKTQTLLTTTRNGRNIKGQRKKGPSIYKSVYSGDEDGTVDAKNTKCHGKEEVIKSKNNPSIFKNDTDEDDEEEDWYTKYQ